MGENAGILLAALSIHAKYLAAMRKYIAMPPIKLIDYQLRLPYDSNCIALTVIKAFAHVE
jgi:hypothetical protein